MQTIRNPAYDVYTRITEAVRENGGYCPCAIEKTEEMVCPCKAFREQRFEGECHCGRFVKVKVKEVK